MEPVEQQLARLVRRHALGWWVAANLVGVWLAAVLVWPGLGDAIAPLSYGRWVPLHLNWQLYGWGALPLVGALLGWTLVTAHPGAIRHAGGALGAWSLALLLGGVSWLGGLTSGKVFLDWAGWARPLLPVAMVLLWTVLAAHTWWRGRQGRERRALGAVRWTLLAGLVTVPPALWWAAGREVYPAVNPDSGGATGASLLGSTLGIVGIYGLLPVLLGVPRRRPDASGRRPGRWFAAAFAAAVAGWLGLGHGNVSHHVLAQVVGLGSLVIWVPLLAWWWRGHAWCAGAQPWRTAALVWWALLVVSGWLTFLPGLSERLKFTNALVGHAHLAMAGLVTSVNLMILNQLDPARPLRRGFAWWQGATALHVAVLLGLGWFERDYAASFFNGAGWVVTGYAVRLGAGVAMTVASVALLGETRR